MSICRNICANGWRWGRRQKAISSSKSTSIRRASCNATKDPAVIGDGRLCYATQRLPDLMDRRRRANRALGDDLGGDAADAGTGQADGTGGSCGQIEDAATDERAAVIDGDDDA